MQIQKKKAMRKVKKTLLKEETSQINSTYKVFMEDTTKPLTFFYCLCIGYIGVFCKIQEGKRT